MYCLRCGYKNDDNATVCKNCNTNIQESQSRYNYDYGRNDHHDQMIYSYRYSNNGQMPERKENDCEDQLDYRYRYSYGTNPPKTNTNTSDNQYNYSERYLYANTEYDTSSDSTNDLIAGDEKYFKAYIGPSFNSIRKQKFSFLTLIFGPFYFFQKQMYAYSLLWLFALIVIGHYQPNLLELSYFLINLFIATKFKKIYISFVDKKIEKIKLQSLDLTTDEIIKKCERIQAKQPIKTNSTNNNKNLKVRFVIVLFVLSFLIPIAIEIMEAVTNEIEQYEVSYQQETLTYEIPEGFKRVYKTDLSERYLYNENNEFVAIEITKYIYTDSYEDADKLIKYKMSLPINIPYSTRLINNKIWTIIDYNNASYYGIILPNDTGYIIKIETNASYSQGTVLINEFVNSLRIA